MRDDRNWRIDEFGIPGDPEWCCHAMQNSIRIFPKIRTGAVEHCRGRHQRERPDEDSEVDFDCRHCSHRR